MERELFAQEKADVIFQHGHASLHVDIELGLWTSSRRVVVCCNKRFGRAENIHIVCRRYGSPLVENYKELVWKVRQML
jgi:hypothetical protein